MILFHGSNQIIKQIDLNKCRPFKDFGKGFYLTSIKEQAETMAKRVSEIYGMKPVVNAYKVKDNILKLNDYSIKDFGDLPTKEWAIFVKNNRDLNFVNYSDLMCNLDNKYDIVHGPVADDKLVTLIRQYNDDIIDLEILLKKMKYCKTSEQYSFHTEKAIQLLNFLEGTIL